MKFIKAFENNYFKAITMRILPLLFVLFLCVTCSSTQNIQQVEYLPINEKDLGIGENPTPPNDPLPNGESKILSMSNEKTKIPVTSSNAIAPKVDKNTSDKISIMSSSGGLLTLWALKPGNWVWGYTPFDSQSFKQAPFWRIVSFSNGQVMIKNVEKGTCLEAYKNGVIHDVCDSKNQAQFWNFNFFDNQAVQIQSVSAKTCLQTPTVRTTTYYSIYLTQCANNEANLDQQWYIAPVIDIAQPIFVTNPL